jgi:excisionase family DNA binding protein
MRSRIRLKSGRPAKIDAPLAGPEKKENPEMLMVDDERIQTPRIHANRQGTPPPHRPSTPLFNTREACHYLRISRPTFLKLIAAGKIRAQKIGKGWKVLDTELERFLLTG